MHCLCCSKGSEAVFLPWCAVQQRLKKSAWYGGALRGLGRVFGAARNKGVLSFLVVFLRFCSLAASACGGNPTGSGGKLGDVSASEGLVTYGSSRHPSPYCPRSSATGHAFLVPAASIPLLINSVGGRPHFYLAPQVTIGPGVTPAQLGTFFDSKDRSGVRVRVTATRLTICFSGSAACEFCWVTSDAVGSRLLRLCTSMYKDSANGRYIVASLTPCDLCCK